MVDEPEGLIIPHPLVLTGRQRELYDALIELSSSLADIYHGAFYALRDAHNPDRLAHAAHGFRELMEKLSRLPQVPKEVQTANLTSRVQGLNTAWHKVITKSSCYTNGPKWDGPIDNHLKRFLRAINDFMQWCETNRPSRQMQAARVIQTLDAQPLKLPPPLLEAKVLEWQECREYFEKVSHHGPCSHDELYRYVLCLERLLLDYLKPRTYEDHSTLDEIIAKGEGRG